MVIREVIRSEKDTLKEIKSRLGNAVGTYNEINCVLADVRRKNKLAEKEE